MSICQAIGCYNTKGKHPGIYHPFPDPNLNKEQATLWLKNLASGYTLQSFIFDNSKVLCGEHFHPDCYETVKINKTNNLPGYFSRTSQLKKGALPTIFKNKVYDIINVNGEKRTSVVKFEEIRVGTLVQSICTTMPSNTQNNANSNKIEEKQQKKMKQSTLSFLPKDKNIMPTFVKVNKDANEEVTMINKAVSVKAIKIMPPKESNSVTDLNNPGGSRIVVVNKTPVNNVLVNTKIAVPNTSVAKSPVPKTTVTKTPLSPTPAINVQVKSPVNVTSVTKVNGESSLPIKPQESLNPRSKHRAAKKPPIIEVDTDSDDENDKVPLSVLKKRLSPHQKNQQKEHHPQMNISQPSQKTITVKSLPSPTKLGSASIQNLLPKLSLSKSKINDTLNKSTTVTGGNVLTQAAGLNKVGNMIQPKVGVLPQSMISIPSKPLITGTLTNPINLAAKIGNLPAQRPMKPIIIMPSNKVNIIPPKNIVIAIDMDPQQWKKLSPEQQKKIIEEKRRQAQQKYMAVAIKNAQEVVKPILHKIHNVQNSGSKTVLSPLKPPNMPCGLKNTIHNLVSSTTVVMPSKQPVNMPTKNPAVTMNNYITTNNKSNFNHSGGNFTDLISEKRYELDLNNLKPLPRPKKIRLPVELKGKHFGTVVMIIQFVNTFKKFLMLSEEDLKITAKKLMYGLTCQKETETISKILLYFLKVLLGNETFKIKGLKMELADLPLTEYTVSYLVEQFLKSHQEKQKKQKRAEEIAAAAAKMLEEDDADSRYTENDPDDVDSDYIDNGDFDDDDDDAEYEDWKKKKKKSKSKSTGNKSKKEEERSQEEKLQSVSRYLEKNEFHKMTADNQLEVLSFLLHLINESEDLVNYHEELSRQKSEACKNLEQYRRLKREEKIAAFAKQNEEKKLTADNNMKIDSFATKLPNADQLTAGVEKAKQAVFRAKSEDMMKEEKESKINGEKPDTSNDKTDEKGREKSDQKIPEMKQDTDPAKTGPAKGGKTDPIKIDEVKLDPVKTEKVTDKEDPYAGMTQRQKDLLKLEAKKLEEKKSEEQRISLELEKEELMGLTKKVEEMVDLCKLAVRLEPLGYDRFSRSYWLFPDGIPGLFINSYDEWFVFDSLKSVDELISALTILGIREDRLKRQLRSRYKDIKEAIQKYVEEFCDGDVDGDSNTNTTPITTAKTLVITPSKEGGSMVNGGKLNSVEVTGTNTELTKDAKTAQAVQEISPVTRADADTIKTGKETASPLANGSSANAAIGSPVNSSKSDKDSNSNNKLISPSNELSKSEPCNNEKQNDSTKLGPEQDHLISSIEALKTDMIESSERIVQGNLGKFPEYEEWAQRLHSASQIHELKEHIVDIQKSIFEKSFLYPFKGFDPVFSTEWSRAVQKAETMSKLHTMYGILENSISWEKSSESLRCKACRRKQGVRNSTPMVICDACQNPYHMNCVRPPLTEIPQHVWRCPKCVPKDWSAGFATHMSHGQHSDIEHQITEDSIQSDHEDLCHVCGTDGLMILCDTCPLSFHFECHDPPLRRAPKGAWSCYVCRQGNKKKLLKKKTKKKGKTEDSDDNEEDENSESNSHESDFDDFQEHHQRPQNGKLRPKKQNESAFSCNVKQGGRKRKNINYNEGGSDNDSDVTKSDGGGGDSSSEVGGHPGNNKGNKNNSKKSKHTIKDTASSSPKSDGLLKVVLKKKKTNSSPEKSENNYATDDNDDEWESTTPRLNTTGLGIKRPRYAKDGVTHDTKSFSSKHRLSSENSDTENTTSRKPAKKIKRNSGNTDVSTQRNSRTSRSSRRESNYELKACRNILLELRNHPDAEPFQNPVNRREFPGYYNIVEHPMDIATIMKKLDSLQYDDVIAFVDDVKMIFNNCDKYYKTADADIAESGVRLSQEFQCLLKQHLPGMAS